MSDGSATLFVRLGGSSKLRDVIDDFVARIFRDVMIGFLFKGKSKERIRELEYRFAAVHLGAPDIQYTGRPLGEAHAASPISSGHFARRKKILEETLTDHGVDPDVIAAWLAHVESLRALVVRPTDACGA